MKITLQTLIAVILISCQGTGNECSNMYNNEIPKSVDEELIWAKNLINENIDSLRKWDVIDKKLAGQKAGVLANANVGLWNLIDSLYLKSITVKNENLIFFEYMTNSCDWKEEYIIYNSDKVNYNQLFKGSKIKVDPIQENWHIIRVKSKNEEK